MAQEEEKKPDALPIRTEGSGQSAAEPDTADEAADGAAPSKKAAKKAEAKAKKEALKAQRAAERAERQDSAANKQEATEDPAKDNYGPETPSTVLSIDAQEVHLKDLGESHVGSVILLRAWLQNVRMQGAKMAFTELREQGNWSIQGIVVANAGREPEPGEEPVVVSKNMVKWVGEIHPESFLLVEAKVLRPYDPVKSCRVASYELHIRKCFVRAAAPATLGMTLAAASRAVSNFSDEDPGQAEQQEKAAESAIPAATMLTHLDNIVIHKRAPVQQAIAVSFHLAQLALR